MARVEVEFHPDARIEYEDAIRWFFARGGEERAMGFVRDVERAQALISEYPDGWPRTADGKHRRILLRRHPFSLVYTVVGDIAWIMAVRHVSRREGYWLQRATPG